MGNYKRGASFPTIILIVLMIIVLAAIILPSIIKEKKEPVDPDFAKAHETQLEWESTWEEWILKCENSQDKGVCFVKGALLSEQEYLCDWIEDKSLMSICRESVLCDVTFNVDATKAEACIKAIQAAKKEPLLCWRHTDHSEFSACISDMARRFNISFCNLLPDAQEAYECTRGYRIEDLNERCDSQPSQVSIDSCYISAALSRLDKNICNNVKDSLKKEFCIRNIK
ncbi:MAG: hypothetical protein ACTSWQ_03725 [Candidatus Thorarchaeota archaeon]